MQFHAPTSLRAPEQRHCFRYLRLELPFHPLLDVDLCNLEDHAVTSMYGCGFGPSRQKLLHTRPFVLIWPRTGLARGLPVTCRESNCVTRSWQAIEIHASNGGVIQCVHVSRCGPSRPRAS